MGAMTTLGTVRASRRETFEVEMVASGASQRRQVELKTRGGREHDEL